MDKQNYESGMKISVSPNNIVGTYIDAYNNKRTIIGNTHTHTHTHYTYPTKNTENKIHLKTIDNALYKKKVFHTTMNESEAI